MKPIAPILRVAVALICLAVLAGCGVPPAATATLPPPTDTPVPPTATSLPPVVEPSATPEPSLAPTEQPGQPPAVIMILDPGRNAVVTNPLSVSGEADPTFEQGLIVQVSDENGEAITQVYTSIAADIGQRGPFQVETSFRVDREQPGRISVFSISAKDGGIEALESVEVTLSPGAPVPVAANLPYAQPIRIDQPQANLEVSGGVLHVEGFSVPVFESQLRAVLCGEGGSGAPDLVCGTVDNILAQVTVFVQAPDMGQPGPFVFDLPYSVSGRVSARLAIYDASPRDGGLTMLSSRNIVLNP